jgi:NitT/TauT family transport system ATP-binding protein
VNAKVGYMLQQDYLLEWRNVLDNVLLGAEIQRMRDRAAEARATALLENYGLGRFLHHMPRQLSGGMRQRVALARTMLTNPDLILLDEPFSALDSQTRVGLADDMVAILKAERKTVILVTHDIAEALAMTDRVIVFTGRPGRVKEDYALSFAAPGSVPLTPMERRSHPEFNRYFGTLWADLKEEEHVRES